MPALFYGDKFLGPCFEDENGPRWIDQCGEKHYEKELDDLEKREDNKLKMIIGFFIFVIMLEFIVFIL